MPWLRVDDGFHGHPKVAELSLAAVGLWTLAGSWSAQYLTDGLVKRGQLRRLGAEDEYIQELVESGLWDDNGDGTYQFHDWADYQPVKADVEAEREAARERMKKVRAAKKGLDSGSVQPNVQANTPRTNTERAPEPPENVDRSTGEVRSTPPSPSQPGPSLPIEEVSDSDEPEESLREDVQAVIDHMMAALKANDVRKAKPGKAWADAARLMIDKDGYTVDQIKWVMDWATSNHFWKANILSVPKLREKFDQLKIQAMEEASGGGRKTGSEQRLARGLALVQAAGEREAAQAGFPAQIRTQTDPFALEA